MKASKAVIKAADTAIQHTAAVRRKIVDLRLPRDKEDPLLRQSTELLDALESVRATMEPEESEVDE